MLHRKKTHGQRLFFQGEESSEESYFAINYGAPSINLPLHAILIKDRLLFASYLSSSI